MSPDINKLIIVEYSDTEKAMHCRSMGSMLEQNLKEMFVQNDNDRKVIYVTSRIEDACYFMDRMAMIIATHLRAAIASGNELSPLTLEDLMKELNS